MNNNEIVVITGGSRGLGLALLSALLVPAPRAAQSVEPGEASHPLNRPQKNPACAGLI